jgi:hypothetical protein
MYAYGTTRFRVPAEPALCVLAAVGIFPLLSRIRQKFAMSDEHDETSHQAETHSFVHGGDLHLSRLFRRTSRQAWASFAVVGSAIAVALPALYRAVGSSMEEGFMLVFPERVIKGDIANVDFLHLYGPGSLHLLSSWMQVFGISLTAERSFGLLQNLLIVTGLMVLTRPWGKKLSTLVGLFSLVFVFTPVGIQALAWNGGVGIALWSVVFAIRAVHRSRINFPTRSWPRASSGICVGVVEATTSHSDALGWWSRCWIDLVVGSSTASWPNRDRSWNHSRSSHSSTTRPRTTQSAKLVLPARCLASY